jgi:signal transduction histidine kinase
MWTLTVVLLVVVMVLSTVAEGRPGEGSLDILLGLVAFLGMLGYATVGAMIVSRHPRNAIGWLFLYFGLAFVFAILADEYSVRALREGLPGIAAAVLVNQTMFPLGFGALPLILLLFPNGALPSRRWKVVMWGVIASILLVTAGSLLVPGPLVHGRFPNPLGVPGLEATTAGMRMAGGVGAFGFSLLSVVGVFIRYRRAGREERQQIRWLAYAGGTGASFLILLFLSQWVAPGIVDLLWTGFFLSIAVGIPAASGIAILRFRLYDLDIVVKKTVVFGVLAAFITGFYVAVVVGAGALVGQRGGILLPGVAAALVALLFQPVRRWAQHLANRVVYGRRATPYELLSEFSGRAGGYSVEDVLPRMARAAAEGTGAASVSVWLRVGDHVRRSATWPSSTDDADEEMGLTGTDLPPLPGEDRTFPVRHQEQLLGALSVRSSAADPLTPAKEKLLTDLAGQAGLILRNVRLTEELKAKLEELRASRQRLVAAQDEERRRLERNIHDGAQQQLVALAVNLRLARTLAAKDPTKAEEVLERLQTEAQAAQENLRDLARGIYPPLLKDKGLAVALEAQTHKALIPVTLDPNGVGRYPQDIEACVYFCVLEALQNVTKYAQADRVQVALRQEDGHLVFSVRDDGRGFDPSKTPPGSGLQNMADRLEAVGGSVDVASSPGGGTTITGRIPVTPAAEPS